LLRVLPECGGQVRLDRDKYLDGSPELIVEVAASSASLDAREKFDSYRRARVREYLLWRFGDETVNWWALEEDEYRPLPVAADGAIHSRIFPGLWLATAALVAGDGPAVMARLHLGLQSPAHNDFVSELLRKLNLSK